MSMEFESPLEGHFRRVRAELEQRVRDGEENVAQKMLALAPSMSANDDLAIELIYTEFVALEEIGSNPSLEETLERYPQWRARLERLLKVHDALRTTDDIDLASTTETLESCESTCTDEPLSGGSRPRRTIGQYDLLDEIGRGGMGLVYKARQRSLNRIVAVKLMRTADNATDTERTRFRIEAEAAATLQHPNIIQIYEVGVHNGCDYLSMEYVRGGSLERRLRHTSLSVREAASLIATLAEAIHVAHENGIIHRDLKPGNVLLAEDVPKISDFGSAKNITSAAVHQTQTGALLGTPCYMAPEQAAGRNSETSAATDVYALGRDSL